MIDAILIGAVGLLTFAVIVLVLAQRRINKKYHKLFDSIVENISLQQDLNTRQRDINELLGGNMEILGVHTKLIPPSVTMQAEAFLRWHNERDKNGEV